MQASRKRLKGIDYFQLLIDHHNKKKGGLGHIVRLSIWLDGIMDEKLFRQRIDRNPICQQIAKIRITQHGGVGYPKIIFKETNTSIPIAFHDSNTNEISNAILNTPVLVYEEPPFNIQVIYLKNGCTCLLFSFHHILFDHVGVQSLLASINGEQNIALFPSKLPGRPLLQRVNAFFKAIGFAFKQGNYKMSTPTRPLPAKNPNWLSYQEHIFTKEETLAINNNLGLKKGDFLLACVCKALHQKIFSQQKNHQFIWVPVPVNFRPKGKRGAVLMNGLSFLFYKLTVADLKNIDSTMKSIHSQMKDQIRKKLPRAFIHFANAYWYVPLPIYYPMFNLPSLGKLSSFSFSSLGNSFPDFDHFLNLPVLDIKNYPSNPISPGLTIVFYEFRGQLRLMTSWVEGWYSTEEQTDIINSIKDLMLKSFRK